MGVLGLVDETSCSGLETLIVAWGFDPDGPQPLGWGKCVKKFVSRVGGIGHNFSRVQGIIYLSLYNTRLYNEIQDVVLLCYTHKKHKQNKKLKVESLPAAQTPVLIHTATFLWSTKRKMKKGLCTSNWSSPSLLHSDRMVEKNIPECFPHLHRYTAWTMVGAPLPRKSNNSIDKARQVGNKSAGIVSLMFISSSLVKELWVLQLLLAKQCTPTHRGSHLDIIRAHTVHWNSRDRAVHGLMKHPVLWFQLQRLWWN